MPCSGVRAWTTKLPVSSFQFSRWLGGHPACCCHSVRRAVVIFVLCLISSSAIGCARRTPPAIHLPSATHVTRDQGSARHSGSPTEIREAIESLKSKVQQLQTAEAVEPGVASQAGDVSAPSAGVGTSGALSVETRYPAQSAEQRSAPRGPLLRRAGDALQQMPGAASFWVMALCALAAGLIVALLLRRSKSPA